MAKFHHAPIAELALQLKMSPVRLRLRELEAAEHLIDLISPDKNYPYDFVCDRITGYRPKTEAQYKTMSGKTLIADLVRLVEQLSGSHPLPVGEMPIRCWTTEELATRLKVSTKTICRWRRHGLPGRKLRYPDGSVRLAFHERAVRRFVMQHADRVKRGASFSQLTDEEKDKIVEIARKQLSEQRMKLHELSQVVSAKVGRAVETVRYTLRRYDKAHPDTALFGKGNGPVIPQELRTIYDAVRSGQTVQQVARRFKKSVRAVRGIIREVRGRELVGQDIQYIYNQAFEAPGAERTILAAFVANDGSSGKRTRAPKDLPPYLQELYRCPLLSTEKERHLFRQYNYLKFKADRMRKAIDPLEVTDKALDEIEGVLKQAETVKNDLLRANLRLVVSIARRHVGHNSHFFETVSDGNLALMRAVEKFDYARGFKFSTYASWAIMRSYARTIPEQHYQSARMVTGVEEMLATAPSNDETASRETVLEAARHVLQKGLSILTDRERDIVVRHYGLDNAGQTMTLEQIGKSFGVTKERIRQIERQAIVKIRENLQPEQYSI